MREGVSMALDSLRSNPKLAHLMRILKVSRPTAVGLLQCLWWQVQKTLSVQPDGVLRNWTDKDVAVTAEWDRDPETFVEGLLEAAFLDRTPDGLAVHHWGDHAPEFVCKRWRRRGWVRDANGAGWTLSGKRLDVASHGEPGLDLASNPTQPNPTKTNPTQPIGAGGGGIRGSPEGGTEVELAFDDAGISTPGVRTELIGLGVTVEQVRAAYAQTVGAYSRGGVTVTKLRETLKANAVLKAAREAKEGREARERADRAQDRLVEDERKAERERAGVFLETVSEERRETAWVTCKKKNGLGNLVRPGHVPGLLADCVDPKWRDAGQVPG